MQKKHSILVSIGAAIAIMIGLLAVFANRAEQPAPVKQFIIPMSAEDFKDDPNLDKAVQNQLEGRPALQMPDAGVGSQLQPTTSVGQ